LTLWLNDSCIPLLWKALRQTKGSVSCDTMRFLLLPDHLLTPACLTRPLASAPLEGTSPPSILEGRFFLLFALAFCPTSLPVNPL
jgi:hypothetical protein